jgi:FkbM family methyltransferase
MRLITQSLQGLAWAMAGRRLELPLRRLHHSLAGHRGTQYDIETLEVMREVLPAHGNAVDVGCHHGHFLATMSRLAPKGQHFGFEPLPSLQPLLRQRFSNQPQVSLHPCALGAEERTASFQHVLTNPAYSGLQRRRYDRPHEEVVAIEVPMRTLDAVLAPELQIHFIKIDVEGGELQVLQGARRTLSRWKPVLVFEHGRGGADWYGTSPDQVHGCLDGCGLHVMLMSDWLARRAHPLSAEQFRHLFEGGLHYYFMAAPSGLMARAGHPIGTGNGNANGP